MDTPEEPRKPRSKGSATVVRPHAGPVVFGPSAPTAEGDRLAQRYADRIRAGRRQLRLARLRAKSKPKPAAGPSDIPATPNT